MMNFPNEKEISCSKQDLHYLQMCENLVNKLIFLTGVIKRFCLQSAGMLSALKKKALRLTQLSIFSHYVKVNNLLAVQLANMVGKQQTVNAREKREREMVCGGEGAPAGW